MKILISILILNIWPIFINAQTATFLSLTQSGLEYDTVPEKITSGLYSITEGSTNQEIIKGSTTHFSQMTFRLETLDRDNGERDLQSKEEQILIVKEGEATVRIGHDVQTIGPNSVFFLLPFEQGSITAKKSPVTYYHMVYTAMPSLANEIKTQDGGSFIIDYDTLAFRKHDKGGVRKYFNRSTAMLPYYEMHVTTLNPGIQSHPPHTHEAAEIILIIEGETEEEIGGKTYRGQPGDIYFLASDVPHAIRNIGDKPCRYFAFQWGKKR